MSKIIVFGASGQTGLCCLKAAIDSGHSVTAFVRNPTLLTSDVSEKVSVIKGDVTDECAVEKALVGHEGVVITLGTRSQLDPTTVMSDGTKNILAGMKKLNIKKVSACISAFLFWERTKVPERFHHLTEDHERMLCAMKESDREWTAVLPPHIADSPAKGDYIVEEGKAPGRTISKYDLGNFLVTCLWKEEHARKVYGICDKPQE